MKTLKQHCDVIERFRRVYFMSTSLYIALIMLIPILTIFICNSLILYKTRRDDIERIKMQQHMQKNLATTILLRAKTNPNAENHPPVVSLHREIDAIVLLFIQNRCL